MVDIIPNLVAYGAGVVSVFIFRDVIPFEYKRWRRKQIEKEKDRQKWFQQVNNAASNIESTWDHEFSQVIEKDNPQPDHSKIQRKLSRQAGVLIKLEGRIEEDDNVDEELQAAMTDLISACQEIENLPLHMNSQSDFKEREEEILNLAQKVRKLSTKEI